MTLDREGAFISCFTMFSVLFCFRESPVNLVLAMIHLLFISVLDGSRRNYLLRTKVRIRISRILLIVPPFSTRTWPALSRSILWPYDGRPQRAGTESMSRQVTGFPIVSSSSFFTPCRYGVRLKKWNQLRRVSDHSILPSFFGFQRG